jgi:hypothetical protein
MVILGDIGLLLLVFISVAGLVLSFVVHFCSLFHIYYPPRELIILINAGIFVTIWPAIIIAKNTRDNIGMTNPKDIIFKVCPRWLSIMTGFLIMYALAGLKIGRAHV